MALPYTYQERRYWIIRIDYDDIDHKDKEPRAQLCSLRYTRGYAAPLRKTVIQLCKKVASAIGALKRVRSFITIDASTQIYQGLIQPHFDYCCTVWDGLGETLSIKLQKLQDRAARVIMRSSYDTDASVLLDSLRWDNLSLRRQKLKLGLMFKTLKSNAPSYLQEFFSIRGTGYNLRNLG